MAEKFRERELGRCPVSVNRKPRPQEGAAQNAPPIMHHAGQADPSQADGPRPCPWPSTRRWRVAWYAIQGEVGHCKLRAGGGGQEVECPPLGSMARCNAAPSVHLPEVGWPANKRQGCPLMMASPCICATHASGYLATKKPRTPPASTLAEMPLYVPVRGHL